MRKLPVLKDGEYLRQGTEDDRFVDYLGAVQSIVTSGGSNDSGMFETTLRDERFLPFEGAGALSTWRLDLPKDYPAFDFATISDVLLHIRYTARQGVAPGSVKTALDDLFKDQSELALLLSLRQDFPSEWSAFVTGNADFTVSIRKDYFPYFTQNKAITITGLEIYDGKDVSKHHAIGNSAVATSDIAGAGRKFTVTAAPDPGGPTQVLRRDEGAQVFLIIRYAL